MYSTPRHQNVFINAFYLFIYTISIETDADGGADDGIAPRCIAFLFDVDDKHVTSAVGA